MAKEEQGAKKGGEDVRSGAMEGLLDGVRDSVGSWSGGGGAFCQRSRNLFCTECGAVCEWVEDEVEGEGGVGGVLIYTSWTLGVHFLMVSPRGVYCRSREREVGVLVQRRRT